MQILSVIPANLVNLGLPWLCQTLDLNLVRPYFVIRIIESGFSS